MLLELGDRTFDVTHRAIVIGSLAIGSEQEQVTALAEALVGAGADGLEVGLAAGPAVVDPAILAPAIAALRARFDVPILAVTADPTVVASAADAGAAAVAGGSDDPAWLAAGARCGLTVVVDAADGSRPTAGCDPVATAHARHAELSARLDAVSDAGIPAKRLLVDSGLAAGRDDAEAAALLRGTAALAAAGHVVVQSSRPPARCDHAARSLGIGLGARVLRATDVRAARRVAAVMAAILDARP